MRAAREDGKTIQLLGMPPLHHPACDDQPSEAYPTGRFSWWQISETDSGLIIGYFHTPKDVFI